MFDLIGWVRLDKPTKTMGLISQVYGRVEERQPDGALVRTFLVNPTEAVSRGLTTPVIARRAVSNLMANVATKKQKATIAKRMKRQKRLSAQANARADVDARRIQEKEKAAYCTTDVRRLTGAPNWLAKMWCGDYGALKIIGLAGALIVGTVVAIRKI